MSVSLLGRGKPFGPRNLQIQISPAIVGKVPSLLPCTRVFGTLHLRDIKDLGT